MAITENGSSWHNELRPQQDMWRKELKTMGVEKKTISLTDLSGKIVKVELFTPPEGIKIPIRKLIKHPEGYRGNGEAALLFSFNELFTDLRGHQQKNPENKESNMAINREVFDLSYFEPKAERLSQELTECALKVVTNSSLYSDKEFRKEYRRLTKEAYQLMKDQERHFSNIDLDYRERLPIIMLRAGRLATEYTFGRGFEQDSPSLTVDAKRIHLQGELDGDLAVALNGFDPEDFRMLHGVDLIICDPAFASGSSVLALMFAAIHHFKVVPKSIQIRSLAGNQASIDLSQRILKEQQINPIFYMLKIGTYLTPNYYLAKPKKDDGSPVVADAGDGLEGPVSTK